MSDVISEVLSEIISVCVQSNARYCVRGLSRGNFTGCMKPRQFSLSPSSSPAWKLIYVRARAEPSSEIQLPSKPGYPIYFWAQPELGSNFEFVSELSRASPAHTFWFVLAWALASFLQFVIWKNSTKICQMGQSRTNMFKFDKKLGKNKESVVNID